MKEKNKKIGLMFGLAILLIIGIVIFMNSKTGAIVQPNDGYVVYFPMNNPDGMSVVDALLTNDGAIGTAYKFNGKTSMITYPYPTTQADIDKLKFINSISIEAWVKPESLKHSYVVSKSDTFLLQLYPQKNNTDNTTYWIYYGGIYFNNNGTRQHVNSASSRVITSADLNKWMHLVFTYDTTLGTKFYVNGVQTYSCSTSNCKNAIYPGDALMTIGNRIDYATYGNRGFNGTIDEVKIYGRALTAAEVTQHYNGCTVGLTTCNANLSGIDVCVADTAVGGNKWVPSSMCAANQKCTNMGCQNVATPICTAGAKQCSSTGILQTCAVNGMSWNNTPCATSQTCSAGTCVNTCAPKTCSSLGKNCGSVSDGCTGTLNCGTCGTGLTCTNNVCVVPASCTLASQCNDGNACTTDSCIGGVCDYVLTDTCGIETTCKSYEVLTATLALVDVEQTDCKFSLGGFVTKQGFSDFVDDYSTILWIILTVFVASIVAFMIGKYKK